MKKYKSHIPTILFAIIIKTFVIFIPIFVLIGLLVNVLPMVNIYIFRTLYFYLNRTNHFGFIIITLSFLYAVYYHISNYTEVKIDENHLIIKRKKEESIDRKETKIICKEKKYDVTILGKLTRNYRLQQITKDGYEKEFCLFSFTKKEYLNLKKEIEKEVKK